MVNVLAAIMEKCKDEKKIYIGIPALWNVKLEEYSNREEKNKNAHDVRWLKATNFTKRSLQNQNANDN